MDGRFIAPSLVSAGWWVAFISRSPAVEFRITSPHCSHDSADCDTDRYPPGHVARGSSKGCTCGSAERDRHSHVIAFHDSSKFSAQ